MSLTIRQQQGGYTINHNTIHQNTYPLFTTITSTNIEEQNFKYLFKLYEQSGLLSVSKNQPKIENGLGVYENNLYLKNILEGDFHPFINTYTPCPNSIINYSLVCEEFFKGVEVPDTFEFIKSVCINSSKEDFRYSDFRVFNQNSRFLTDFDIVRDIYSDNIGNLRFFSGVPFVGKVGGSFNENVFKNSTDFIMMEVHRDNLIYFYRLLSLNPYRNFVASTDNTVLEDLSTCLLEYPIYPDFLNTLNWFHYGILDKTTLDFTGTSEFDSGVIEIGDIYGIAIGKVSEVSFQNSTEYMYFKYKCVNKSNIQVLWKNEYGAYDFFNFDKVYQEDLSINHSVYRQKLGKFKTGNLWNYENTDRGLNIFHTDINETMKLNSKLLTDRELKLLDSLFISDDVYIFFDGELYPVISLNNVKYSGSNRNEFKQLEFDLTMSRKKYN